MTSNSDLARQQRAPALPILAAIGCGVALVLHLLFGSATAQRTTLAVVCGVVSLAAPLLGASRARSAQRLGLALGVVGLGCAALLGVSYR